MEEKSTLSTYSKCKTEIGEEVMYDYLQLNPAI